MRSIPFCCHISYVSLNLRVFHLKTFSYTIDLLKNLGQPSCRMAHIFDVSLCFLAVSRILSHKEKSFMMGGWVEERSLGLHVCVGDQQFNEVYQ